MKVWKFTLNLATWQEVIMPKGATILHVDDQAGSICIWALCDPRPGGPSEIREFWIVGTGRGVPEASQYIASVQQDRFVWHVFETIKPVTG